MGDRTGVDLTVVSPSHSNGAAALLLGDVGGQDAVAEHRVVEVQVTLLLLVNGCGSEHGETEQEDLASKSSDKSLPLICVASWSSF